MSAALCLALVFLNILPVGGQVSHAPIVFADEPIVSDPQQAGIQIPITPVETEGLQANDFTDSEALVQNDESPLSAVDESQSNPAETPSTPETQSIETPSESTKESPVETTQVETTKTPSIPETQSIKTQSESTAESQVEATPTPVETVETQVEAKSQDETQIETPPQPSTSHSAVENTVSPLEPLVPPDQLVADVRKPQPPSGEFGGGGSVPPLRGESFFASEGFEYLRRSVGDFGRGWRRFLARYFGQSDESQSTLV